MNQSLLEVPVEKKIEKIGIIAGMRVPKTFFVTEGIGESDITVHAGSYHLALKDAGIERFNIMVYSSILPGIAEEVPRPINPEGTHGAVMETITACETSRKGERATAGIIFGWLKEKDTEKKYGGLVCEYHSKLTPEDAEKSLRQSLNELHQNGYENFDNQE